MILVCASPLQHQYVHGCICAASLGHALINCNDYHMGMLSTHKRYAEFFVFDRLLYGRVRDSFLLNHGRFSEAASLVVPFITALVLLFEVIIFRSELCFWRRNWQ